MKIRSPTHTTKPKFSYKIYKTGIKHRAERTTCMKKIQQIPESKSTKKCFLRGKEKKNSKKTTNQPRFLMNYVKTYVEL